MIILLEPNVPAETHRKLVERVRSLDLDVVPLELGARRALEIVGSDPSRVLGLADADGVLEILTRRTPLVSGEPIWPHFTIRVLIATLLLIVLLALLTAFFPPGLGDRATATPPADAPSVEWYLRPLEVLLHKLPAAIGGWVVLLFWLGLFLLPFLDRADTSTARGQLQLLILRVVGLATLAAGILFALGVLS